jgi:hypothetical protein
MSEWLIYDDFVERVQIRHLQAFSGLLAGVTDSRHSFQIGFERGKIILLTYRLCKGLEALRLITGLRRARIAEHPIPAMHAGRDDLIDTDAVLEVLAAGTADDTTTITRVDDSAPDSKPLDLSLIRPLDERLKRVIEAAALRHFGPIGVLLCEEQFEKPDGDVRSIVIGIAREVEASEDDTRAFMQAVART